jgi:radical SAM-linked protein
MSERRRAELDGGRSGLSAAEGGTISGRRPMRLRLRFQKLGKVRWTSHRDVARMWERACRRIQLPLAYTEGFSPRPKMHFGLALPTGAESVAEYLDLDLADDAVLDVDVEGLAALLSPALPAGVDVTAVAPVDPRAPSLQEDVESCTWRVAFAPDVELAAVVDRALASSSLLVERERKGRLSVDDVRPAILALSADATAEGEPALEALVATRPRALRPQELLQALDPALEAARVCRTHQWIERDGLREEPLAVAPHAVGARAQ